MCVRDSVSGIKSRLVEAPIREVALESIIINIPPSDYFLLDI
jgi:hypothetical protein